VFVKKQKAQERYDICKACDRFSKYTFQCKECGCIMKIKVTLIDSKCPLNKWLQCPQEFSNQHNK